MIRDVVVDTGPLIALLELRDQHHAWVQSQFAEIVPPLLTCEAVLTEACYLARRTRGRAQATLELFERGVVRLAFDLGANFAPVSSLIRRYANVPMSLADACLVRMSELVAGGVVFTLDCDFRIYRRHGRQKIPLVIPPDR
ncbi:MAG TPA: PIN domain-containing protein [Gemmataceae bacterium]|nr:PIN domain-containing protein [Gemmataceae bacterium]